MKTATTLLLSGFVAFWLLLTNGDLASLVIGLPAIAGAVFIVLKFRRDNHTALSLPGILRFIPYFLLESIRGGWRVAVATLTPRMPLSPAFIFYDIGLGNRTARVFFMNCVSLLPGTLAADLQGNQLSVHVLDDRIDTEAGLIQLEEYILSIFPDDISETGVKDGLA
jgi:multicomponent Na+:H+ antiporter subunit E